MPAGLPGGRVSILAPGFRPQVTCRVPSGPTARLKPSTDPPPAFAGSITALATPFTPAGALDPDALRRLIDRQLAAGTQALVVAGSTGEAAALSSDEFTRLLQLAVRQVAGQVPVLAGTGQSATAATIERTRLAADAGADLALVVTPPYVRPTAHGLLAHFQAVAEHGGLPVVLYNVPGRTGCDLQPETVARLQQHPGIVAIKEAKADPQRIAALLQLRQAGFAVLSGDDPTAADAMLAGADGVVSVASNAVPAAMRRLCDAARSADAARAAELDAALQPLFAFLAVESNPIPLKALLAQLGYGHRDGIRLPLTPLSAEHLPTVAATADQVHALESA